MPKDRAALVAGGPLCQHFARRGSGVSERGLWAKKSFSSLTQHMPKYIIEREIAGAGKLTPEQLQGISQKSCGVLKKLGPQIQWLESYVTDDKIYCVLYCASC